MILFWTAAALLVALALAILLPPLLRARSISTGSEALNTELARERLRELDLEARDGALDPAQLDAARDELKRELLLDVGAGDGTALAGRRDLAGIVTVTLAVPLLALGLYISLGDRGAVGGVPPEPGTAGTEMPPLPVLIERLEERLAQQPDDPGGWLMLARTYSFSQRWEDAGQAFARAHELAPGNPDVMVEYAGLLARQADGNLAGRPAELVRAAMQQAPQNLNVQFLMGHVHYQEGRAAEAVSLWRQVAAALPPGSPDLQQLNGFIAQAAGELGSDQAAAGAAAPVAGGRSIAVSVTLDAALRDQVAPDDTLFVYARATSGPRMPLAIQRLNAAQLPLTVTLDESMAMVPNMTLAQFEQVTVEARISKSGSAIPQSGDIRGTRSPITPGAGTVVDIVIDSRVP